MRKLIRIVTLANENPGQFLSKPVHSENVNIIQHTSRDKANPRSYSLEPLQLPRSPKASPKATTNVQKTIKVSSAQFAQSIQQNPTDFGDFDSSDEEPTFSANFESIDLPTPPPVIKTPIPQNQRQKNQSNIFRHVSPRPSITQIDPKIRPLPTSPTSEIIPSYQCATWFYNIDRSEAKELLKNKPSGCFLIRPSSKPQYVCTLTMVYMGNIYNLGIARNQTNMLRIGEDTVGKKQFMTVEELIEYYVNNELSLQYQNQEIFVRLKKLNM